MSSRGGKPKGGSPAVAPREWVARDTSGRDTDGQSLTTVQLWWKGFEEEAKSQKPQKAAPSDSDQSQPSYITSQNPKDHWYGVSTGYWEKVEATDDGMLGGFASITSADLVGSYKFLNPFLQGTEPTNNKQKVGRTKSIDIGAGIGRITKGLLSKLFEKTDMMEQNADFLEKAKTEVEESKQGECFVSSLQNFNFDGAPYDVIWIQWVLLYLVDSDLIAFLKRAKKALGPKGVIIIKENHTRTGFFVDNDDNSITRSDAHFRSIFDSAGLKLLKAETQTDFPKELFPVTMYALI